MREENLRWRKSNRFYHIYKEANLFGGDSIVCSWGSYMSKRGNHKIIICGNSEELSRVINKIVKTRKARGYELY